MKFADYHNSKMNGCKARVTDGTRVVRGKERPKRVVRYLEQIVGKNFSLNFDKTIAQLMTLTNHALWSEESSTSIGWARCIFVHQLPSSNYRMLVRWINFYQSICINLIIHIQICWISAGHRKSWSHYIEGTSSTRGGLQSWLQQGWGEVCWRFWRDARWGTSSHQQI